MKISQETLISFLENKFGREGVTLSSDLACDIGMDSLDQAELVLYLDSSLGVETPEEAAEKFKTVQDVWDYIQSQQQ